MAHPTSNRTNPESSETSGVKCLTKDRGYRPVCASEVGPRLVTFSKSDQYESCLNRLVYSDSDFGYRRCIEH